MTGLAELSGRQHRLNDIRGLMTAMKSLALVETRKLARVIDHQRALREHLEGVAAEFLAQHPDMDLGSAAPQPPVLLVLGAERGFCGGFDEPVLKALAERPSHLADARLVLVGRRLASRFDAWHDEWQRRADAASPGEAAAAAAEQLRRLPPVLRRLDGATVTEDVPAVLERIVDALLEAAGGAAPAQLVVLAQEGRGAPVFHPLLPLPRPPTVAPLPFAARLNLTPAQFLAGLLDQWLPSALLGLVAASLAAESHQRLAHMQQALDRLDDTLRQLQVKRNALRQERIVEEIEVMLASAMSGQARRAG
jgi:F-type H+-transporting ATPase subunit gamma